MRGKSGVTLKEECGTVSGSMGQLPAKPDRLRHGVANNRQRHRDSGEEDQAQATSGQPDRGARAPSGASPAVQVALAEARRRHRYNKREAHTPAPEAGRPVRRTPARSKSAYPTRIPQPPAREGTTATPFSPNFGRNQLSGFALWRSCSIETTEYAAPIPRHFRLPRSARNATVRSLKRPRSGRTRSNCVRLRHRRHKFYA